ncbi:hypothetical protein AOLI_G00295800 [Acnodon oligacanthus]
MDTRDCTLQGLQSYNFPKSRFWKLRRDSECVCCLHVSYIYHLHFSAIHCCFWVSTDQKLSQVSLGYCSLEYYCLLRHEESIFTNCK